MARPRKKPDGPVVRVQVYRDEADEFRLREIAGNGKVLGDSGEGYANRSYAMKMAARKYPGADVQYVG